MKKGNSSKYVIYNLRETYHELGDYEFKIVLDPRGFENSHTSDISIFDPDGKEISCSIERWGRKMRCNFKIDESIPDGVSVVKIILRDSRKKEQQHFVKFWVIKP
jgi:hypothetical protein